MNPSTITQINITNEIQSINITHQQRERTNEEENPFIGSAAVSRSTIRRIDSPQESEPLALEDNVFSHTEIKDNYTNQQDIKKHFDCFLKSFKKLKILQDYIIEQIQNGNIEENLENGQLQKDIIALDSRYYLSRKGLAEACVLLAEEAVAMIEQTLYSFPRDLLTNLTNPIYRSYPEARKKSAARLYHMALLKIDFLQKIIAKQNKNLDALKRPELKVEFSNYAIYRIAHSYFLMRGAHNRPPNTPFGASSGNSFPLPPIVHREF